MPNTLVIEGMAQTAGILVGHANDFAEKVILAKIARARFSHAARPGDMIRYTAVIDRLDHYHLNDVMDVQTSAENISIWIWNELLSAIQADSEASQKVKLYEVRVWETPQSSAIYRGE